MGRWGAEQKAEGSKQKAVKPKLLSALCSPRLPIAASPRLFLLPRNSSLPQWVGDKRLIPE